MKAGNPERARKAHLARSGSQSEHRIRFILPAPGASHIIINFTNIEITSTMLRSTSVQPGMYSHKARLNTL